MNHPRPALMPLDEALADLLMRAVPIVASEPVSTFEADGRVLAQDVVSALQVPPNDNSSMDGYAVRSAELQQVGTVMPVSQRIAAGSVGTALRLGSVARIFTGAPIPDGADAVLMQEDTEAVSACESSGQARVRILSAPTAGQWIRRAGEDVMRGSIVLRRGTRLGPADLGLAASIGLDRLQLVRAPRVALFSTGDELVMPGSVAPQHMKPGAIYNSNRYLLRALLQRLGCRVSDLGIVPDQRVATEQALQAAAAEHDLILTSGGVSVGEEDHIKPAVQAMGELNLWQIAIKPGKPFAYGCVRSPSQPCHFIGLPGNPVSSFITFLLLVRPFVQRLQGVGDTAVAALELPAHFDWLRPDKRREFLRVRRNDTGGLELFANQSSGVLTSAVWGDGVVDNPPLQVIRYGDRLRYLPFSELLK